MNSRQLFREIGELDEELVIEAENQKGRSSGRRRLHMAAAACVLVAVGCLAALPAMPFMQQGGNGLHSTEEGTPYTLTLNRAESQSASSFHIPGHFWEELDAEELKAVLPGLYAEPEVQDENLVFGGGGSIAAMANYRGDASLFNIDVRAKTRGGMEAYIQLAPGHAMLDYVFDSETVASDVSGTAVTAGYFEGNDCTIYFAEFAMEDVGYYVEVKGAETERLFFERLVKQIVAGGKADFSVLSPVVPELRDERLTETEAYEEPDFGAYLPRGPQKGFAFEEGARFINQELDFLSAMWTRAMDYVEWRVSEVDDEDRERITSPADRKNYDLSLYPIPRADSVPKQLRDVVDDPVFRAEELTLQAVSARAEATVDQGDDRGIRMNFSVLYGDILVEVRTKGVSPQAVYHGLMELPHKDE